MPLLNSQIIDIQANGRLSLYATADGSVFIMGRDFRPRDMSSKPDDDLVYGIPKRLNIPTRVSAMSLGENHMIILSNNGQIYSMGSN